MTEAAELVAIAMAGGEVVWADMSSRTQHVWLEKARIGLCVLAARVQELEAERNRFGVTLQ
jgi:hypothetical protein